MESSENKRKSAKLDSTLLHKAEILKQSKLFIDPSDGAALMHKQAIFLVLAGRKPMTHASSGHWVSTPGGRHTEADDPQAVSALLKSLGLAYRLSSEPQAVSVLVALDPVLINEYGNASSAEAAGHLFGYPDTAVAAFINDTSMPTDEQQHIEKEAGIPDFLPSFKLSRDHWREELSTLKEWCGLLRAYGLGGE